jgi:hypothetical protein
MRILISVSCLLVFYSMNLFAVEPIDEQQIMLYYQVPLGAANSQDSKHQFGLRFDRITHAPGEDVQISTLENRPAAMDFRMGYDGIKSVKIHGVDYASYLIARAAEGETAPAKTEPAAGADTKDTPAAAAPAEGATTETSGAPKEGKSPIQDALGDVPFGVYIGVIIGIVIIAGVGG